MDEQLVRRNLELARRHVADAEVRMVNLCRLASRLEGMGASSASVHKLLESFETNLEIARQHVALLEYKYRTRRPGGRSD